jgi:hypothetical protein
MHKFGVFTALALSWITASCAERMVHPAVIPQPTPPKAVPKPQPEIEVRSQAERIAEETRKRLAVRSRQVNPSAGVKSAQPSRPQAPPLETSQQPSKPPVGREPLVEVALPPPEPDESNFPFAALMPPPPEAAEPVFPLIPPVVELPLPPEPTAPLRPEVPIEEAMPAPPELTEPSFPVAAPMPLPPEPAEPSLPSREEITAQSSVPIPYPELSAPLSLQPRIDWEEVTGSFEIPRSQRSEASDLSREERIPSLIRNPWPLLRDGS